jgi:hypothetical protein
MPAPDPEGLWTERDGNHLRVHHQAYFWSGEDRHRRRRAVTILRRMVAGTWACRWCGDPLPDWRRADAQFCCEGCRKRAARMRRG